VENLARRWRADIRGWRARASAGNCEQRLVWDSHRKPRARHLRVKFSTGGELAEIAGIYWTSWRLLVRARQELTTPYYHYLLFTIKE